MLNTKRSNINLVETRKRRKSYNFDITIKPSYVAEYNTNMVDVNKQDQMPACFPYIKWMKGYKKMAFYLIDKLKN